jgi:peptidyl-tRNA hydrolase
MKMYILIKDDVPPGFAVLAAAHGSLAAYLKFRDTPEVAEWLTGPSSRGKSGPGLNARVIWQKRIC